MSKEVEKMVEAWEKRAAKAQKPISGQLASAAGTARAGLHFAVHAAADFDNLADSLMRVPALPSREEVDYIRQDLEDALACLPPLYEAMDAVDASLGKKKGAA